MNKIAQIHIPRNFVDETNKNRLQWQCPLRDRKTNFRMTIYPENLAKIVPVDFEIIGLSGIVKNEKQQQTLQQPGGLNEQIH